MKVLKNQPIGHPCNIRPRRSQGQKATRTPLMSKLAHFLYVGRRTTACSFRFFELEQVYVRTRVARTSSSLSDVRTE